MGMSAEGKQELYELRQTLLHLRVKQGMTREEAAERAGIDVPTLVTIEETQEDFDLFHLLRLARVYGAQVQLQFERFNEE